MRTTLRVTGTVLVFLFAALALPIGFGAPTVAAAFDDLYSVGADLAPTATPAPSPPPHDPTKPTAVVVVGDNGAVVSDSLAPYEVLATSGAFNVYTVASRSGRIPLTGGLDLVPDLTFAALDELLGGASADVVIVPALPDVGEPTTRPVTEWLNRQSADGALLLSVCNGSGVLASAGLLDGRAATAHWYRVDDFADRYPAVNWRRGTRYVDDGNIITTAGVLSGIDGTLRIVERMASPATAARVADTIGWRYYHPGTAAPLVENQLEPSDAVVALNTGFTWDRDTTGVLLTDGVGEIELASVFDTYAQSLAIRSLAVAPDAAPVRSRHGLTFVPRAAPTADLSRLVVPGADAARRHAADPYRATYLHTDGTFPFDGALRDLAGVTDTATARWTAKMLEYPTDHLTLTGPSWPWALTLRPIGLAMLGLTVAFTIRHRRAFRVTSVDPPPSGRDHTERPLLAGSRGR